MTAAESIALGLIAVGLFFLFTAALGILRFPDTLTRLHALAKADNPALGCLVAGLVLLQPDLVSAGKLVLVWSVTQLSSAASGFGLARRLHRERPAEPDAR